MTDATPSVSVIVPTRRRPYLLRAAVQSIIDQRYPGAVEILVITDGETVQVPVSDDPLRRVLVLTNSRRPGAAGARNTALLAATGQLVALCDDDDQWLPTKLAVQVAALERDTDAIGIGSGYEQRRGTTTHLRIPQQGVLTHADLLRSRAFDIATSTLMFWREQLLTTVGLLDEDLPGSYGEDYDWLLRITASGHLLTVAEPLVRVLAHPGSYFSGQWPMIARAIEYLLDKHPDLSSDAHGRARLFGRLAFAYAAMGRRRLAWRWAGRALASDPRQPRSYLAMVVSAGVPAQAAVRLAEAAGRGV